MRAPTDIEINCGVRRVLVQHWIDLGRLSIRTTRGVVYLSGTIDKLRESSAFLGGDELNSILQAIQRLPGVRRVHSDLTGVSNAAVMQAQEPATDPIRVHEFKPQSTIPIAGGGA